ncbi:MAG TPA: K(+)-transporting ATPase subunit C [Acidimicrobiales bacterium]|nr:K(+)-transporting ATPase subunit C [Acidimicrobiales bacterium]
MRAQVLAALRAILVFTVLLGLAYPLAITGVSQLFFNDKADGSLVENADGEVVGSKLLGQTFTGEEYFHGRPSAAGGGASGSEIDVLDDDGNPTGETMLASADDISTAASGGSNLGPTNEDLLATVQDRIDAYRDENGLDANEPVPVDAVTASGSGVDPSISITNARLQAPRVAEARGMDVDEVRALVDDHTSSRSLGFLGEKGVNVLELNIALDELSPS